MCLYCVIIMLFIMLCLMLLYILLLYIIVMCALLYMYCIYNVVSCRYFVCVYIPPARKNVYANYRRLNYKSITNQSMQSIDIGHACISLCETFKSINIQCVQQWPHDISFLQENWVDHVRKLCSWIASTNNHHTAMSVGIVYNMEYGLWTGTWTAAKY